MNDNFGGVDEIGSEIELIFIEILNEVLKVE